MSFCFNPQPTLIEHLHPILSRFHHYKYMQIAKRFCITPSLYHTLWNKKAKQGVGKFTRVSSQTHTKKERERVMRKDCHPLLKGKREDSKYRHGFSPAEMESLRSMCEVVLPPLPLDSLKSEKLGAEPSRAVQSFWTISASRHPIPHEVSHFYSMLHILLSFLLSIFSILGD